MSYMHVENLYKKPTFLETAGAEIYALEKIHGTSARFTAKFDRTQKTNAPDGTYTWSYSGGSEKHDNFVKCFNVSARLWQLNTLLLDYKIQDFTIYGEAYGGKQQGMKATYGDTLKFVAFDVMVDGTWLTVPKAEEFCKPFGIEFVHWVRGPNTLEFLDAQRDADSVQAIRNGMGPGKIREGIVCRPLVEVWNPDLGERLIFKHKRKEFLETATARPVDPSKIPVLEEAKAIANEWVVEERLNHVVDKLKVDGQELSMRDTPRVLDAMIEDIKREAAGEVVWSNEAEGAIRNRTRELFKKMVTIPKQ